MEVHLAEQTLTFLSACVLGMALGAFYDVFRILRIAFPTGTKVVFVQDVLYWAVCAFLSFLFLLTAVDGVVRAFLLIGELLGGVVYHYTLGEIVMRIAESIIAAVAAILRWIYRFLLFPAWRIIYGLVSLLLRPVRWLGEMAKKTFQRARFRLKVRRIVLYNHCIGLFSGSGKMKRALEKRAYGARTAKKKTQKKDA